MIMRDESEQKQSVTFNSTDTDPSRTLLHDFWFLDPTTSPPATAVASTDKTRRYVYSRKKYKEDVPC